MLCRIEFKNDATKFGFARQPSFSFGLDIEPHLVIPCLQKMFDIGWLHHTENALL